MTAIIVILFLIAFFVFIGLYVKAQDDTPNLEETTNEEVLSSLSLDTITNDSKDPITFSLSNPLKYDTDNLIPSSYTVYSTLKFLLYLSTYDKEKISFYSNWIYGGRILEISIFNDWGDIVKTEEVETSLLGKLKSKNLITITQEHIPTQYDSYGFVERYETYRTKLTVTEKGINYCQEHEK